MSKFNVLVIGPESYRDLEDTLEPYDEHIVFPTYIKFTREDKKLEKKKLEKYYRKELKKNPTNIGYLKLVALQEMTTEEHWNHAMRFYGDAVQTTTGEPTSTYNPNSRWNSWDYYHGLASKTQGGLVDFERKKNINWMFMEGFAHDQAIVDWLRLKDCKDSEKKLLYGWWDGETKEQYIERKTLFLTPAYVLRGKWYERGKIGWWGEIDDTVSREDWMKQYREMLTSIKPDTVLTTITCRI